MNTNKQILSLAACFVACVALALPSTKAQVANLAKNPSPELVGQLSKELSITPEQATGGAGALFGLAKTRLKPAEFSQVSKAVPGMDGLLNAAPKPKDGASALGSLSPSLPGKAGGLAQVAGSFKSRGLPPE